MAKSNFFNSSKNPVSAAISLTEAVAIKITPDYVTTYKYKDGVKAKGLIPVNIKHANIDKHFDQLVDPDAGDPLANLVIGTIPKYYKKASDLKPKDPTKSVSDLMSKKDDAPTAAEPKDASSAELQFSGDTPVEVQNAAEMLGYKPGSSEAEAIEALFKYKYVFKANAELAEKIALAQGKPEDDEDTFDAVLSTIEKVVDKGTKKGIFTVSEVPDDEDEDDDDEYEKVSFASSLSTPIKKPEKPAAPAPAPVAAPTPVAPPALSPMTSGIPEIPPLATLTSAGDAKSIYGGYHAKSLYKDAAGNKFMFKPESSGTMYAAQAAQGYSQIAEKVLGKDHTVPVTTGTPPGATTSGSIQPIIPNVSTDLSNVDLTSLIAPQLNTLLKHRVLDWAMSQHDAKAANFLLTKDSKIIGIDKDQAFKFIGKDFLDPSYKPNPSPQIYQNLFDLYVNKKLDLDFNAMLPAIKTIEEMSDDAWLASFSPYISAVSKGSSEGISDVLKNEMLYRKNNLRADLEKLATILMRKRGEIGPKTKFYFEPPLKKKKKKSEAGVSLPVASGPSTLPPLSSLVKGGSVPGATNVGTQFYTGPNGEKYVVKKAIARSGPAKPQPWRVAAQVMSANLGEIARPGKTVPVAEVSDGVDGFPATIQKWEDGSTPLGSTSPKDLTDSEKTDIAQEHVVDWLLSQHDTHKNNLLRRKDGTIVGIDKEQGFKFFPNDKLSTDYHPNTMEDEPYYNKFWRAFADGSMDFDPKKMLPAIERLEAVSKADYAKEMAPYAKAISSSSGGSTTAASFVVNAVKRKTNLRKDFEGFLTDLYQKRTGTKGTFSFDTGWSVGDQPPIAEPLKKPKKKKPELLGSLQSPAQTGVIGNPNTQMFEPAGYKPPPPPPAPPIPAGYPPPSPGKMWKVQPASTFFAPVSTGSGGAGGVYKVKPALNKDKQPDSSLPEQIVKFNPGITEEVANKNLSSLGITPIKVATSKTDGKVYAIVNKEEYNTALQSGKEMAAEVPLPPPPPPPAANAAVPIPMAGQLQNPEATDGIEELAELDGSTPIGWAKNYRIGGANVKDHSLTVIRKVDKSGKTFYQFSLKLRDIKPKTTGKNTTYTFKTAEYDPATDSFKESGATSGSPADYVEGMQLFSSGDSQVYIGSSMSPFSFRGRALAHVYPEKGETPLDAFRRTLEAAMPKTNVNAILKDPTPDEDKLLKFSALYSAAAPQASDKLTDSEKNLSYLRKKLNALGYTDSDLDSIRMEQVGVGVCEPVLPGRWKKVAASGGAQWLSVGVSNASKAVMQVLSGSIGVNTRGASGLGTKGLSPDADQKSGGADYVYATPVNQEASYDKFFEWGNIQLIYDPSELDRLGSYTHDYDSYGCCDPKYSNSTCANSYKNRKTLEKGTNNTTEVCLKSGMNSRKLLKLAVKSAFTRQQLLEEFSARGVSEVNGTKVEDLVVVVAPPKSEGKGLTSENFYETTLKPAGY